MDPVRVEQRDIEGGLDLVLPMLDGHELHWFRGQTQQLSMMSMIGGRIFFFKVVHVKPLATPQSTGGLCVSHRWVYDACVNSNRVATDLQQPIKDDPKVSVSNTTWVTLWIKSQKSHHAIYYGI